MTYRAKNTFQLLQPLERAELFNTHLSQDKLTRTAIARKYGKSLAYVSNTMRLLTLPPIIKEGLTAKEISEGHARALLTAKSIQDMVIIYRRILLESISVRKTEKLARESKK